MTDKNIRTETKIIIVLAILVVIGAIAGVIVKISSDKAIAKATVEERKLGTEFSIQSFRIESERGDFEVAKDGAQWISETEQDVSLDASIVSVMLSYTKNLYPERILSKEECEGQDFGLGDDAYRLTLYSDGEQKTITIGDYNSVLDEYYTSVSTGNEGSVYMVKKTDIDQVKKEFVDLVAPPDFHGIGTSAITEMRIVNPSGQKIQLIRSGSDYQGVMGGKTYDTVNYSATNVYYTLNALGYDYCVTYRATDEMLSYCGLDDGDAYITFVTDSGEYTEILGTDKDGNRFLTEKDSRIIFMLTEDEYTSVMETIDKDALLTN